MPRRGPTIDESDVGWRGIVAFLLLTFAWSWGFWGPKALYAVGLLEGLPVLPELGAFGPTVAAFVLVAYDDGLAGVRRLVGRAVDLDVPKRWLAVALGLPTGVAAVSLAVAVATGTIPEFPWAGNPIVLPVAFVFVLLLGGPLQEEFGWRGYLLDPLQERITALGAGLAIGVVWAVWHLPLFYIPSDTIYYRNPFLGFAVSITLLSVLMTWVYNNTDGSLLPVLLFHTAFNWSQGMFPILDSDPASLTMVALLAVAAVVAVVHGGPRRLVGAAAETRAEAASE